MIFRVSAAFFFSLRFELPCSFGFLQNSFSQWPRAQTLNKQKMQHSPRENVFFKVALSRKRRQKEDGTGTKSNSKIHFSYILKIT